MWRAAASPGHLPGPWKNALRQLFGDAARPRSLAGIRLGTSPGNLRCPAFMPLLYDQSWVGRPAGHVDELSRFQSVYYPEATSRRSSRPPEQ